MNLYNKLKTHRESIGAPWFTDPWDLNLLVIRSGDVGKWDDVVVVCCKDDVGRKVVQRVRATGDAWAGEWIDPTHPDGCVYVLDGHYPQGLVLGEHKGRPALRQNKPFDCVRWPKKMGYAPTVRELEELADSGARFSGNRGTHLHNRYNGQSPDIPNPNDSEGCTVSLYYHQHAAMIELVKQQEKYRGSRIVSPTFLKKSSLAHPDTAGKGKTNPLAGHSNVDSTM